MKAVSAHQELNRYAAKMLFQYRFYTEPVVSYRIVEERIVLITSKSSRDAYNLFTKKGKSYERKFKNDEGEEGRFEFIGIQEMVHLGIECEDDEVWYSLKKMKLPMERCKKFIPEKSNLSAIRYESKLF